MEKAELKKLDNKKLGQEIQDAKKDLFKARFEVETNQSKNTRLIRHTKRYVAWLETEKTNRALHGITKETRKVVKK